MLKLDTVNSHNLLLEGHLASYATEKGKTFRSKCFLECRTTSEPSAPLKISILVYITEVGVTDSRVFVLCGHGIDSL